jgi:hypothetical protein
MQQKKVTINWAKLSPYGIFIVLEVNSWSNYVLVWLIFTAAGDIGGADLQDLPEAERAKVLKQAGMSESEVEEAITFLTAFPYLALAARCEVDGEEDIREQDPVKCRVRSITNLGWLLL